MTTKPDDGGIQSNARTHTSSQKSQSNLWKPSQIIKISKGPVATFLIVAPLHLILVFICMELTFVSGFQGGGPIPFWLSFAEIIGWVLLLPIALPAIWLADFLADNPDSIFLRLAEAGVIANSLLWGLGSSFLYKRMAFLWRHTD